MNGAIFYFNFIATLLIPVFGLLSFGKLFKKYREKLDPSTLYVSIFLLLFSASYLVSTLRILIPGHDISFLYLNAILHPVSLVFAIGFCVSILWSERVKPSFIVCSLITIPYIVLAFVLEKEVVEVAAGVTEVVFPQVFLIVTLLTLTPLGFLPFVIFLIYSLKTRWSSLRRNGLFIAFSFLTISIFACTFDWPGLFSLYLPVFRIIITIGIVLLYVAISQSQRGSAPPLRAF
jgi:hypothetical protein